MWDVVVADSIWYPNSVSRSGLERPDIEGDIPVGENRKGYRYQPEYLALTLAKEDGGKWSPRLNTFQDR